MISGAHMILYSKNVEADRAFFRDVLKFPFVDVGHDWLIFALPPSEIAVHPDAANGRHEIYLMCDDVDATVQSLQSSGIVCEPVSDQGWGRLTQITLPGGGKLGLYQPRHALAPH
ncbi:MAG: hypothetical protein JWP63_2178 [Candidatus Solibacter sp.]|jgi:predicted enzyme related to lactoylglutathione lyase|nr:hypothetical protein [Candidatus Solibacter sp.]